MESAILNTDELPHQENDQPTEKFKGSPVQVDFDLQGPETQLKVHEEEEINSIENSNDSIEFLHHHQRFGHISPKKIVQMAKNGVLPAKLAKCKVPICTACLYGKAIKRGYKSKESEQEKLEKYKASQPGEVVAVDMMTSPTPGLVAQMAGFLTSKRYKHMTIFVDQATGYGFTWQQYTTDAEETLKGKVAFEKHMQDLGIKIKHYHADNGIFASKAWKDHCNSVIVDGTQQGLTFAGVNAHHQNSVAERRIGLLQHMARTMLIHANRRWPDAITTNLWPYAIRMANDAINATPNFNLENSATPIEVVAKTKIASNPKHWHHFGCPVYVLDNDLQGRGIFHK